MGGQSILKLERMVRHYNGTGDWSEQAVVERYLHYAEQLGIQPLPVFSRRHAGGGVTWVFPVMNQIIAGIEISDAACTLIGIEFIEQDQGFPFGRTLKSNTARALRRAKLSEDQCERLRRRIVGMLLAGYVPYEFKEYAKLLRRVGIGSWWPIIEEHVKRDNRSVMRFYNYFRNHVIAQ